ncbi:MAG: Asd/ArgC dimerization domain-containing protein [Terriglobales bacterium]
MTAPLHRVAIVGAATLKGRELKDVLADSRFPADEVRLLDDDESLGQLEAVGDEATFVQSVRAEQFERVDMTFFASEPGFTRKHVALARKAGSAIVDLSAALEEEAPVHAPRVEMELEGASAKKPRGAAAPAALVAAHPASVVLALLLLRVHKAAGLRAAVVTVFEPASEHGKRGLDELHAQTIHLLSFQSMPTEVFDSQVAFNLLSRYGEESQPALESVERRILAHFEKITAGSLPVPSLMLVQAPTFHSHSFSIYIEAHKTIPAEELARSLHGGMVTVTHATSDAPTNVSAAGQDQVLVALRKDPAHENGWWLWAAADNLRIAALTAVDCAMLLAEARPLSAEAKRPAPRRKAE